MRMFMIDQRNDNGAEMKGSIYELVLTSGIMWIQANLFLYAFPYSRTTVLEWLVLCVATVLGTNGTINELSDTHFKCILFTLAHLLLMAVAGFFVVILTNSELNSVKASEKREIMN